MVSLFPMAQKSSADGHPFAHDSSINAQIVSNISALSYGHTNGYLLGGDIINDQAECNGSTQFGEYIDANSINGEALNGLQTHSQIFIAICGIALRLSGGLRTFQQLWEFLLDGGDARVRVFSSRYNVAAFHDSIGKHGTVIIDMLRMEVERADPHHRLMLEVARECFEDAGETAGRGKRTGCYMGSLGEDWCEMFARETQNWGPYRYTGYGDFALFNRVFYEMDLQGPSVTARTACSASFVALHEACVAISRGDCDSAIVGGANLIMASASTMSITEQNVLSKDGSCKTFSADADGYARGEAIVAVYIKRLDDALRDENPIRAIIRETAINHNGKTSEMTVLSAKAQKALMKRAHKIAGITDFLKTGFVECHGTGTSVGDLIEINAVGRVFGESGVYIKSIKFNFGHTENAFGLLSVIKTVLVLQNRIISLNIKCMFFNPAIFFEFAKLTVFTEPTFWPRSRLERASVNAFDVSGVNAHAVIDSVVGFNESTVSKRAIHESRLLLFSANSPTALTSMVDNYRVFVKRNSEKIGDLVYTLAHRRENLPCRTFAIARNGTIGITPSTTKSTKAIAIIAVFTGQGAQWPQMGRDLMDFNSIFLRSIRRLDKHLQGMHEHAPEWKIEAEFRKTGKKSRVHIAEFFQSSCTAIQIALVDVLAALKIRPNAVVGHFSGEIADVYAVDAFTAEETITNALHRGVVTNLQKRSGAMAAVGMSWKEIEKHLVAGVAMACENSFTNVTISGDADKVEAVCADIQESKSNVIVRKLHVDKVYYFCHMV